MEKRYKGGQRTDSPCLRGGGERPLISEADLGKSKCTMECSEGEQSKSESYLKSQGFEKIKNFFNVN